MTEVPVASDAADIAANDGKVVTLVGHYRVVATGRHQIMYELPDGTTGTTNEVVRLVPRRVTAATPLEPARYSKMRPSCSWLTPSLSSRRSA